MLRECKTHGISEFGERSDGRWRCKQCAVDAVNKWRRSLKERAVSYMGGKCVICGYHKYNGVLQFHHLRDKDFSLGQKGVTRSWQSVKKELSKCVLVCTNCHIEIHNNIIDVNDYILDSHSNHHKN